MQNIEVQIEMLPKINDDYFAFSSEKLLEETLPKKRGNNNLKASPISIDSIKDHDKVQNLRSLRKCKSREQYLEKVYKKYGDKFKFDFSNWSGITGNKIKIICPIHGEFEQTPRNLLASAHKTGCKQCGFEQRNASKTKDYQNFIDKANIIYNHKYEYICDRYKNRKSKVRIICKEHGEFIKSAQKHLSGQACWKCKTKELVEKNILVGGYNEDLFADKPELKTIKACLYYISINKGRLYKIGISKCLEKRMKAIKWKAKGFIKNIDLMWTIEDTLYNCFKKEQEILEFYKESRVYFKWSTEIFSKDILPIRLDELNKNIPIRQMA